MASNPSPESATDAPKSAMPVPLPSNVADWFQGRLKFCTNDGVSCVNTVADPGMPGDPTFGLPTRIVTPFDETETPAPCNAVGVAGVTINFVFSTNCARATGAIAATIQMRTLISSPLVKATTFSGTTAAFPTFGPTLTECGFNRCARSLPLFLTVVDKGELRLMKITISVTLAAVHCDW